MSKDVKILAKNFTQKAKDLGLKLSHSQSLELLAFSKGFSDWNAYSASLKNVKDSETNIKKPILSREDIKEAMEVAKIFKNFKDYKTVLENCLKIVNSIHLNGGLSRTKIIEISQIIKEDEDKIEEYFEQAYNLMNKVRDAKSAAFFEQFEKDNLNVFEFLIDEEQFYIVARNVEEAEVHLRNVEPGERLEIQTLSFVKKLSFDELNSYIWYDEDDTSPPEAEESWLEKLSHGIPQVPYLFAQSLW